MRREMFRPDKQLARLPMKRRNKLATRQVLLSVNGASLRSKRDAGIPADLQKAMAGQGTQKAPGLFPVVSSDAAAASTNRRRKVGDFGRLDHRIALGQRKR